MNQSVRFERKNQKGKAKTMTWPELHQRAWQLVRDTSQALRDFLMEDDVRRWFKTFLQEFVEATVYIYVLVIIVDRPNPMETSKILRIAFFIGFIESIMLYWNSETHAKIKDGLYNSVGSSLVRNVLSL